MRKATLMFVCALVIAPGVIFAQGDSQAATAQPKAGPEPRSGAVPGEPQGPKFVRSLTNVQVELVLTDQMGSQPAEKKTVSMIVSSGHWGKVRSAGTVAPIGSAPFAVELNVDARPFVSMEGQIQLELVLEYSPPTSDSREALKTRPTGMNQSLTVVLQNAKPLVVSQAADPVSDRKVIVEVKATILK